MTDSTWSWVKRSVERLSNLKAAELKMHPVEVFDVDYPWRNLTFGLQRARGGS